MVPKNERSKKEEKAKYTIETQTLLTERIAKMTEIHNDKKNCELLLLIATTR